MSVGEPQDVGALPAAVLPAFAAGLAIQRSFQFPDWGIGLEAALLASLVVVGLTIPVAYLSSGLFEDPFIRLGKRPLFKTTSFIGLAKVKTAG
jgi:peptidoglycan/LPS O-acetylase OafA/YrhL